MVIPWREVVPQGWLQQRRLHRPDPPLAWGAVSEQLKRIDRGMVSDHIKRYSWLRCFDPHNGLRSRLCQLPGRA